ncbi:hypothetical protein [Lacticaseibacillus sharpeae]|uniref:hypothetical protein n=1 Tax=Lacticaseibacillus sharpeae TaxID=1626 RepID=UPI0006D1EBC8|nr:hypothetical protein [Lacticaseibacillus sharpeae]
MAVKKKPRTRQDESRELLTAVLKLKGVTYEDWLDQQVQAEIEANTELIVKALLARSSEVKEETE